MVQNKVHYKSEMLESETAGHLCKKSRGALSRANHYSRGPISLSSCRKLTARGTDEAPVWQFLAPSLRLADKIWFIFTSESQFFPAATTLYEAMVTVLAACRDCWQVWQPALFPSQPGYHQRHTYRWRHQWLGMGRLLPCLPQPHLLISSWPSQLPCSWYPTLGAINPAYCLDTMKELQ